MRATATRRTEEAEVVKALYRELLRGRWTDASRTTTPLTPDQILIVAPYNAQVELLTERLQEDADAAGGTLKIGTVDKIQGQQAAVVIYSMATSSQDELPRTLEFLYSLNRLNVATSRGRCMAVLVCSPDLLRVRVHTPFQMRLANALCRFVEIAKEQVAHAGARVDVERLTLAEKKASPGGGGPGEAEGTETGCARGVTRRAGTALAWCPCERR